MMTSVEFDDCLSGLGLSDAEAAELLSIDPRTIRRWRLKPTEISGPAEQALRAWLRLESLGLAWRPDGIALGEGDKEKLARTITAYRDQAIALDDTLARVKRRGGPAAPWAVDLGKKCATLGGMKIAFYAVRNGGFSPSTYSRRDMAADMVRDQTLLEDGYAAIAREIAKAGRNWADATGSSSKSKGKQ